MKELTVEEESRLKEIFERVGNELATEETVFLCSLVRRLLRVNVLQEERIALLKPDPGIDRAWAEESQRRWNAFRAGRIKSRPHE